MENEIHLWHDASGRITAWGQLRPGTSILLKATPLAPEGYGVITTRLSDSQLPKLHETHFVDVQSGRLIKKDSSS